MTAPAATTAEPGLPVRADGRPAVVLWALLVTALLALLPCAGSAKAVGMRPGPAVSVSAGSVPASAASALPGPTAPAAASRTPHGAGHHEVSWADDPAQTVIWCTADGGTPGPGKGCTSHPFCGPEAQLPNAPPQPAAVVMPLLVTVRAMPVLVPAPAPAVSGPAPDLHVLQVQRT